MRTIQWYPGHMARAMRQTEEALRLVDGIVLVLDARCPAASYNKKFCTLAGNKPVLFVLNKGDLADGGADEICALLKRSGKYAVKLSATSVSSARVLSDALLSVYEERARRYREKGVTRPLRFLVAGIPNTGKSTLINLLAGGKKAKTGDKAGVTRERQWVKCGAFDLLDTPGIMPPSCEDQLLARRLAYVGCINDDILALDEIALSLLEELAEKYPAGLAARYGLGAGEPLDLLNGICKARGFLARNGEYDYERGERALIDDLRKGKLGKVCFDGADDASRAGLTGA